MQSIRYLVTPELQQRIDGIPIFQTLRLEVRAVGPESATTYMPFAPEWSGIFESLHGGFLMTLADTAACLAILAAVGSDIVITTTDMNIRFLAACLSGATAVAKVVKIGKTLCPVDVQIRDDQGALVAIAQVTYMRLSKMPTRSP